MTDIDIARTTTRAILAKSELVSEQDAQDRITSALNAAGIPVVRVFVDFRQNGSREAEYCVIVNGKDLTQKVLCTKSMIQ